ncbi:MAG TPA: serine/threonine-protein kinase, partial [Vicinamibacterales bacterium]
MSFRPPLDPTPTRDIGRYRLAHRIAVGGMAEVYRALWPQAAGGDRAVVIKRLLPALVHDPEQRAMFAHEAELGRRIDHPNVVAVLDHGEDDGTPYIVLEYVFGVDLWRLTRWMRRTGRPMRVPLAVWLGTEMLSGLAAVHAVRDDSGQPLYVVHRDVSPSNIFLSVHGDVKLGDLGIARAALFEAQRRGGPGFRAKGKLGYLPPEQVAGKAVDQRGDVFAAAVVIAELLLGKPLFAGGTEIGVLLAIRDGDVSAFRAIVPSLPPGL